MNGEQRGRDGQEMEGSGGAGEASREREEGNQDRSRGGVRELPPDAAASIAAAEAIAGIGTVPTMSVPPETPGTGTKATDNNVLPNGDGSSGAAQPWPGFDKFASVQGILDSNRLLIHEIKHNHETRDPDGLIRNVALIRELNENIAKVVDLYGGISETFVRAFGDVPCDS